MTRYIQFANNAVSRLAGNITDTATTLTVLAGDGDKFPILNYSKFFMATLIKSDGTSEIVKVTARSGDVFTIQRAADKVGNSQVAYAFSANDRIENRLVAQTLEDELDRLERLATPASNRLVVDTFTGAGSAGPFTLSTTPSTENDTFVYIGGVYQNKGTYYISGADLTVGGPVDAGVPIEVVTATTGIGGGGSGGGGTGGAGSETFIQIVDALPGEGAYEGQIVMLASNSQLYVWNNGAWVSVITSVTGLGTIEVVDTLPATDNFEGRMVLLKEDGKIYTYVEGVWVAAVADVTTAQITDGLYTDGLRTIEIVDTLPDTGNVEGRMAFLTTDKELYVYKNGAWVTLKQEYTPDAPSGIEVVSELPTTGNYADRTVFLLSDNKLYKYVNGVYQEIVQTVSAATEVANGSITTAKFASGITPVEIVTTLPTTGNFDGRMVFLTTDSKLYRHNGTSFIANVAATDLTGQIGSDQIAASAIVAGKIAAGAISATEIAANAIIAEKLAVGAVTAEKITSLAITADKIAAGAITAGKIAADAIVAGNIQAGAIGATQIAASAITTSKLAASSVAAANIQASAITADKIAALAITADKIAAASITSGKIAADAIVAGNISAGAIGASQLAANAVTAGKIAAGAVTATNIAAGTITATNIATGAITSAKIGAGEISATNIASSAVTAAKIAANAITVDKLTSSSATFNGGTFTLGDASVAGYSGTAQFSAAATTKFGMGATNTLGPAFAGATSASSFQAGGFYNSTTSAYTTHRTVAEFAFGTKAGVFTNVTSNRWIELANASYAYQTSGGAAGTFTGAHDGLIPKTATQPVVGDIIVDVVNYAAPNVYDTLHVNAISSGPNQKGTLGVMAEFAAESHVPTALMKLIDITDTFVDDEGNVTTITRQTPVIDPAYTDIGDYNMILVNALGEGMMNVCGEGGDIEIGDLIVTSSIAGKGMKQADDCIRSYTVAKAREAVTFSSPTEIKMVSCIYLAG